MWLGWQLLVTDEAGLVEVFDTHKFDKDAMSHVAKLHIYFCLTKYSS